MPMASFPIGTDVPINAGVETGKVAVGVAVGKRVSVNVGVKDGNGVLVLGLVLVDDRVGGISLMVPGAVQLPKLTARMTNMENRITRINPDYQWLFSSIQLRVEACRPGP